MANFNRVILLGNITRDLELRYVGSGTAVTDVGLAVNDRRKNANGEVVEETTFVDVTLWGRTAEVACEYLSKGSPVLIEGRLKYDAWDTPDGQRRSKLRVVGEKLQMLSGRGGGGGGFSRRDESEYSQPAERFEPDGASQPAGAAQPVGATASATQPQEEGDIPF